jgi:hypothetical protein
LILLTALTDPAYGPLIIDPAYGAYADTMVGVPYLLVLLAALLLILFTAPYLLILLTALLLILPMAPYLLIILTSPLLIL